jgi:hypothetical protein
MSEPEKYLVRFITPNGTNMNVTIWIEDEHVWVLDPDRGFKLPIKVSGTTLHTAAVFWQHAEDQLPDYVLATLKMMLGGA